MNRKFISTTITGILFVSFFILGNLFPDVWWGTHHLFFLPLSQQLILVVIGLWILWILWKKHLIDLLIELSLTNSNIFIIGLLIGLIYWFFPIASDNYGEAGNYRKYLSVVAHQLPEDFWRPFFVFDLKPETGRNIQLALITFVSWCFHINYETAFKILDTVFGIGFVWTWLKLVRYQITSKSWQTILAIAGLTAPFTLVYFGHIDTYANVFLGLLTWLFCLIKLFNTSHKKWLWWLIGLYVLNVKLHPLNVLLTPGLILAFIWWNRKSWLFTYRRIGLFFGLPILITGLILYFLVFEDHNDPRILRNITDFDRLFLPLFSPSPPLDRYNLFSINHFFDFLNVLLLWCPPILFLTIAIIMSYKKSIPRNNPLVLILVSLLVLYTSFLFTINPLVTMPMDWDLFSFPVPILLVLILVLFSHLEKQQITLPRYFLLPMVVLIWFSLPVFMVNCNATSLSKRLESVGLWIFRSYYEKAPEYIYYAHNLVKQDKETATLQKKTIVEKLEPYAIPKLDINYATLLTDLGAHYYVNNEYKLAYETLQKGPYYYPNHRDNRLYLLQTKFALKRFKEASEDAKKLVELNHPTAQKSLRIAIHVGLEARKYKLVETYADKYLNKYPSDSTILTIKNRIRNNENIDELKLLFSH